MKAIMIPPDIEVQLIEEARRQGITAEQLVIESLRKIFNSESREGESLFDYLHGYIGAVSGTTEALSENCGQHFSDSLLEKQQRSQV